MNYDKTKYKVWTWKNPMMLHWIINPGVAIIELEGQRIPKVMLIERNSPKSVNEKSWIPCLTNLTTYLILGLTFPIWVWFKDKWKAKWIEKQKVKFSNPLNLTYSEPTKSQYFLSGLFWGIFMYVFMTILFPLIQGENLTQRRLLIGIPIWAVAGFLFGFAMKIIKSGKRKSGLRKAESLQINSVGQRPTEKTTSPERA